MLTRMPPRLLILWHSQTGATRQLAEAIAAGAAAEGGVEAVLRHAGDATAADVLGSAALVVCCPEYLAAPAGAVKDFFDRSYYALLDRVNGMPVALAVCAGSDGQGALRQLERIARGLRLRPVAEPLLVITHAQTPEAILAAKRLASVDLERGRELGATLAAGLAMGLF
jgi:NAD(P)H-dependent FMN reductase